MAAPTNNKCAVCLSAITDSSVSVGECKHIFHEDCIVQWFKVHVQTRHIPIPHPFSNHTFIASD
ncbi:MAG: hypothetical protein CMJ95_01140 [Planctomycetes bacterium]|nr:hypothetical protein [Planctomycetota bacterium]